MRGQAVPVLGQKGDAKPRAVPLFSIAHLAGSLPQKGAQQKSLLCTLPCGSIAGDSNYADGMVTVLYRCPNTGFRVQGYPAEEESVDRDGHLPVTCLACKFVHLVNPKTGEVLGQTRPPTE